MTCGRRKDESPPAHLVGVLLLQSIDHLLRLPFHPGKHKSQQAPPDLTAPVEHGVLLRQLAHDPSLLIAARLPRRLTAGTITHARSFVPSP
eukprot:744166-Hanusia_phi.AAC.3